MYSRFGAAILQGETLTLINHDDSMAYMLYIGNWLMIMIRYELFVDNCSDLQTLGGYFGPGIRIRIRDYAFRIRVSIYGQDMIQIQ